MRISRIVLPGFGALTGFSADLAPGLNVIYGENEAGKSTLQQAICAMLYGFFENDRALRDETARHERFRPWAGGAYRGSLAYELEDGRTFEVRRDFTSSDVITQVLDATLGTDVSAQFGRGRHGNVPFARKHLGMSRGVFQSCAFISQGEVFELDRHASPNNIGDAIAAMADSARRDVSAAKAIERLDAAMQRVGSDRARTAELPVARDHLKLARAELAAADEGRRAMAEKSRRLDELQARLRTLAEQAQRAEYLLHRTEATRLRMQIDQLAEADALLGRAEERRDALRDYTPLPAGVRDDVINLRGQLQRADESLARLHRQHEDLAPRITGDTRLEYEALRERVGSLTEDQVRSLETAAYRMPGAEPGFWARLARVIANAARAIVRFILRRSAPVEEAPEPSVSPAEALSLLEKHRRYLTLRPLIDEASRLDRSLEADANSREVLERRLIALLESAGITLALPGQTLRPQPGSREGPVLSQTPAMYGVSGPNEPAAPDALPNALAAFEERWQKGEELAKAEAAADNAARRCALLLNGRSPEDLSAALADHESEAARMADADPRLRNCQTGSSPEQLSRMLQKARDDHHRTEVEATRLDEEVRLALDRYRPRAEIEEELAHWEREVARLEKARTALTIAKATIQEAMTAVYRDFAPAVNSFLSEGIEAATGGRYRRAHVDPSTLRVSLLVPETDQVVTDPPVSHGTRTLLYVLMRIGLAQHMSAIGEPVPLVLDDPFVDVDAARLPLILDFLESLSGRMQVLVFTKDRQILEWFETKVNNGPHRLHIMPGALTTAAL